MATKKGSRIASLCTGSFLLAATGLLDGKRATTNWMVAPLFKKLFPLVKLEDHKVIIDEGDIYSCAAGFSSISFIVYLIEKFAGHAAAVAVSKTFLIQLHDIHENAFSMLNFQRDHNDKEIIIIQDYIEKNYNKGLFINELAFKFNMSNRTLIRRFHCATGNTPLEYIQRVKIEAAKKFLEKGNDNVEQICIKAGYEDLNFFRTVFKRYTGISPQRYKKKFQNLLV